MGFLLLSLHKSENIVYFLNAIKKQNTYILILDVFFPIVYVMEAKQTKIDQYEKKIIINKDFACSVLLLKLESSFSKTSGCVM